MLPFDIRHPLRDADYGPILTGKNFIRQQKSGHPNRARESKIEPPDHSQRLESPFPWCENWTSVKQIYTSVGRNPLENPGRQGVVSRPHERFQHTSGEVQQCIRPGTPLALDDARRLVQSYVDHYNNVRLNSATGYITPKDMLAGRQQGILANRSRYRISALRGGAQPVEIDGPWNVLGLAMRLWGDAVQPSLSICVSYSRTCVGSV
jgi:hypothetical protein